MAAERFGAMLHRWRTIRGITAGQLARDAGIDRSTICRLEQGSRLPSRAMLIALADALSLTGAERALFIGSQCYTEYPLTEAQASMLAGWRDGFARHERWGD